MWSIQPSTGFSHHHHWNSGDSRRPADRPGGGGPRIKAGKGFFVKPGRFFVEHYDKFKFWGTIALMVVYFFLLDKLGFTFWSIICLFLFNTLFANKAQLKTPGTTSPA